MTAWSRRCAIVLITAFVTGIGVYVILPRVPGALDAVVANECRKRMRNVYVILYRFVENNGRLPSLEDGSLEPSRLLCLEDQQGAECIEGELSRCALCTTKGDDPWCGFVWCKPPSPAELAEFKHPGLAIEPSRVSEHTWVILCHDDRFVHSNVRRGRIVLLSDGTVFVYSEQGNEYVDWLESHFKRGESAIPKFMVRQINAAG
jgi:hypothetical protein